MKIMVVGDVHWSEYCSIVRKQGANYSVRLEGLINSVNWVEHLASTQECDNVVYLGDFFDKALLNANEITALKEIRWSELIPHYMLVGNHEIVNTDTSNSTLHYFSNYEHFFVVDKPSTYTWGSLIVTFIPYITENSRKDLREYLPDIPNVKHLIFSHNDIAGLQMGPWLSDVGFGLEEISEFDGMYFNGHLHNNMLVSNNIINVGILSGRDFGENALKYKHYVYIYDTETGKLDTYENPYAFNFIKLDWVDCFKMGVHSTHEYDLVKLKEIPNTVVCIRCRQRDKETIQTLLSRIDTITEIKYVIEPELSDFTENTEGLTINHFEEFRKFCLEHIDNTPALETELDIICGGGDIVP